MLRVAVSYTSEGKKTAELLCTQLKQKDTTWDVVEYPMIGKKGDPTFWPILQKGMLRADAILFIGTENFIDKYKNELDKINRSNRCDIYTFAWLLMGSSAKLNENTPCDIEVKSEKIKYSDQNDAEFKLITEQVYDQLALVELVSKNKQDYVNQRRLLKEKEKVWLGSIAISYVGLLILTVYFSRGDYLFALDSIGGLLSMVTVILSVLMLLYSAFALMKRYKKKVEEKEKAEFSKELEMSLSKNPINYIPHLYNYTRSNHANSLADLLSTVTQRMNTNARAIRLREQAKKTSSMQKGDTEKIDSEIALAMGDDEYLPLGHLKFNWKQMFGYYDISKKQAKTSFYIAVGISFIGILIIVFAILSPIIPAFRDENSLITVIGTIGGAVVELFAGTILIVYRKSLSQMNLYHDALSKYQKYLSCVNLVSKLSSVEKQDQLYEEIIRSEMKREVVIEEDEGREQKRPFEESTGIINDGEPA